MSKLITIKKSIIFKEAYKRGISIKAGIFVMKFLPFCVKDHSLPQGLHFGFIISKKVGISVKRNFIRRRLKNAIHECLLNFNNNGYYIFIAQNEINDSKYSEILCKIKKSLGLLSSLLNNNENSG